MPRNTAPGQPTERFPCPRKPTDKLPECTSIRSGRGWAEPEVWFRIVHVALDGPDGAPVAAYREQTVEIALGPKEAFENGNVGTLTRRVAADRVINALAPRVRNRKPPKAPRTPSTGRC